jgi:hypothetical protein
MHFIKNYIVLRKEKENEKSQRPSSKRNLDEKENKKEKTCGFISAGVPDLN